MKIISLSSSVAGPACAIGVSIKNHFYNGNYKTNIFDYLEITMKSINQILNTNASLIYERFHNGNKNDIYLNHTNNYTIDFKNFDKIMSHHDLHSDYTENDYKEVINKIKRRYDRLIEYIKNEDQIFFIRYGNENMEDIVNFLHSVNRINDGLKIIYIQVSYEVCDVPDSSAYIGNYKIYRVNFYNHIDHDKIYNSDPFFKTLEYDWNKIYNIIYENLDETNKRNFVYSS